MDIQIKFSSNEASWLCFKHAVQRAIKGADIEVEVGDFYNDCYQGSISCKDCFPEDRPEETFTCELCQNPYIMGLAEADALAEEYKTFGKVSESQRSAVCYDCYFAMLREVPVSKESARPIFTEETISKIKEDPFDVFHIGEEEIG